MDRLRTNHLNKAKILLWRWNLTCGIALIAFFLAVPNAFSWTIALDFEQGTVGQLAQGLSGCTVAYPRTLISSAFPHSGSKSAQVNWLAGSQGAGEGCEIVYPTRLSEGQEVWVRFFSYVPPSWPNAYPKLLRGAHVVDSSGGNIGYFSIYQMNNGGLLQDSEIADTQQTLNYSSVKGQWECYEQYIKFTATPQNGIYRIWRNGVLVGQRQYNAYIPAGSAWPCCPNGERTLKSSSDYAFRTLINTYWNAGAPSNLTSYFDDVVITSDRPSNRDAAGNYMIGCGAMPNVPMSPTGLSVK